MSSLDIVQRYVLRASASTVKAVPRSLVIEPLTVLGVALMTGMLKKVGHDTLAWVYYPVHDRTGAEIHIYP